MTHSIFAPSSMPRLVRCVGSFDLVKLYPEPEDSPSAMEGTAAHEVCASMWGTPMTVGSLASNGVSVTEEMLEGAELYYSSVPFEMLRNCRIEEQIEIPSIHEKCFGTPDLWYYEPVKKVLHIHDYKFGHGYVDVFEHEQLIAYASGIIDEHGYDDQEIWVSFTIVQPRCFHRDGPVRSWGCRASDLRGKINQMRMVCESAERGEGVCQAGAHCRHCPAAHACPALQAGTQAAMDFTAIPIPSEMTAETKGVFLRRLQQAQALLKAMGTGLEEEVERELRRGVVVPGYALEPGQGGTTWSKPLTEVATLGDMFGVNLRKDALITPIQAAAALKKAGIDVSVLSQYSEVQAGALKLTPIDENRTRRIFGNLKEKQP